MIYQGTEQSKTLILPLSLENNASITGTALILEDFVKEFVIPCMYAKVVLPYDEKLQNFNIEAARKHYKFLYLLQEHKKERQQLQEQLTTLEKQLADSAETNVYQNDSVILENAERSTGIAGTFQKIDGKFKKVLNLWRKCSAQDNHCGVQAANQQRIVGECKRSLWIYFILFF